MRCIALALALCSPARAQETLPFDHIHLAVPDVERARDWYIRYMGGAAGETTDDVAFGRWTGDHPLPIQLLFMVSANAQLSAGSAIGSIGFSFIDLDATMAELRTAGVKVVTPVTMVAGLWKRAVVEDPWGTTLELVQDPDVLGLHHVTLMVPNPEESLGWYATVFGGERIKLGGQVDAIKYRDLGIFYLVVLKGDHTTPSQGHSIDHISWGPLALDRVVADLTARGVTFTSDSNPRGYPACAFMAAGPGEGNTGTREIRRLYCAQPDQLPHRTVSLETPDGVRIELVQHLEAGGGH